VEWSGGRGRGEGAEAEEGAAAVAKHEKGSRGGRG